MTAASFSEWHKGVLASANPPPWALNPDGARFVYNSMAASRAPAKAEAAEVARLRAENRELARRVATLERHFHDGMVPKVLCDAIDGAALEGQLLAYVSLLKRLAPETLKQFEGAKGPATEVIGAVADALADVLERREPVPVVLPSSADIDAACRTGPAVHYRGVWDATSRYIAGDMVTMSGAGWIAVSAMAVGIKPGAGDNAWVLAIKSDTSAARRLIREELARSKP